MTIIAIPPPDMSGDDPDLNMGVSLVAYQRRQKILFSIKLAAVWGILIVIITFFLFGLNLTPSYPFKKDILSLMFRGAMLTIFISFVSIIFATILALLGSLGRLSGSVIAQGISGFYVSIFRGTPLLIQIFIIYLGLPQLGMQIRAFGFESLGQLFILKAIPAGILALSLNYGAYMTEIFRAGIQSIHHGQREAAEAIGMSRSQTLRRVILPQALRIIIPDIGNQFIAMQKDSAQVYVMGVWEITYLANRIARLDNKFMEMFLLAALMYWILTIISSWLESFLEKRLSHAYER
jgi:polar amino acid transport system permease protein